MEERKSATENQAGPRASCPKITIAIDGFSSCGKSTLARQLAESLDYLYIDSGAMYRAITLYFLHHQVRFDQPEEVQHALRDIKIEFILQPKTGKSEIYLNGENVERQIRDMIVAEKVSTVATIKEVRDFAVARQREMGKEKGIVMDGRDIGTVVFPDAELKIFMTADPEVRVTRRYDEALEADRQVTVDEVRRNLQIRDFIDSHREESPLTRAEDARVLDNTHLSKEEQLERVLEWMEECCSGKGSVPDSPSL